MLRLVTILHFTIVVVASTSGQDKELARSSYARMQTDTISGKLTELRSAEDRELPQICRSLSQIQRQWLTKMLAVNSMLLELDPDGQTEATKHIWEAFAEAKAPEALPYLIRRIDHPHEHIGFWRLGSYRQFIYPMALYQYDDAAAAAFDRYLATTSHAVPKRNLQLLRNQYGMIYRGESAQAIVTLRLARHVSKGWTSDCFQRNTDALLDEFERPRVFFESSPSLEYQPLPPLSRSEQQIMREYCGSVDQVRDAHRLWRWSRERIIETCLAELKPDHHNPPAKDDIKKQALVRLLYDVRAEEIMLYLYSWADCEHGNPEVLRMFDSDGKPAKYPYLEMSVQYGELNVKPLVEILAEVPAGTVPDKMMQRWGQLVRRIYGETEADLALAEAIIKFHGGDPHMVPASVQQLIRAMREPAVAR